MFLLYKQTIEIEILAPPLYLHAMINSTLVYGNVYACHDSTLVYDNSERRGDPYWRRPCELTSSESIGVTISLAMLNIPMSRRCQGRTKGGIAGVGAFLQTTDSQCTLQHLQLSRVQTYYRWLVTQYSISRKQVSKFHQHPVNFCLGRGCLCSKAWVSWPSTKQMQSAFRQGDEGPARTCTAKLKPTKSAAARRDPAVPSTCPLLGQIHGTPTWDLSAPPNHCHCRGKFTVYGPGSSDTNVLQPIPRNSLSI